MPNSTPFVNRILNATYSIFAIGLCLLIGYGINFLVDIVPASLYGMFIMAVGLKAEIIKADKMASSIDWVIKNMGVCFVPAGVGVMEHFGLLKIHGAALITLTIISTILLMLLVGYLFQYFLPKSNTHLNDNPKNKVSS